MEPTKMIYTGSPSPITVEGYKFETGKAVVVPGELAALLLRKPMFIAAPPPARKKEKE
ncbi:MAG: hypothetical protein RBR06_06075 [Desulfuromonadaceae bacterium]|nr:hypothetical protein [Desulfuromonadaceae bacterium]